MPINITFRKTGREIKQAITRRRAQLQSRLDKRNQVLAEFLKDPVKVRSYIVRSTQYEYSHGHHDGYVLFSENDISSEEKQEIQQVCQRIFEMEQELHRLALVVAHLQDKQVVELSLDDLIEYGFEADGGIEAETSS